MLDVVNVNTLFPLPLSGQNMRACIHHTDTDTQTDTQTDTHTHADTHTHMHILNRGTYFQWRYLSQTFSTVNIYYTLMLWATLFFDVSFELLAVVFKIA